MTCSRTSFPWDVVINRVGDKLFFDKRERSSLDYWTVNETAAEQLNDEPKEAINTPDALALEATYINRTFSQHVLKQVRSSASLRASGAVSHAPPPLAPGTRARPPRAC